MYGLPVFDTWFSVVHMGGKPDGAAPAHEVALLVRGGPLEELDEEVCGAMGECEAGLPRAAWRRLKALEPPLTAFYFMDHSYSLDIDTPEDLRG